MIKLKKLKGEEFRKKLVDVYSIWYKEFMQVFMLESVGMLDETLISKKKESVLLEEKERFVKRSIENGYRENDAINVYNQILKFLFLI